MAVSNLLQQVQTYQKSDLAYLLNLTCAIETFNTKFLNFQEFVGNLGSTVNFDLPARFLTTAGLVATFQPSVQRLQPLSCDQAANTSATYSAQEMVFNLDDANNSYMDSFGKAAMIELANQIEANVLRNFDSSVPVNTIVNGQTVPTGALHTESGPFRFMGNGITAINSYTQLQQFIELYKNFGSPKNDIRVYLPNLIIPGIIGSGLAQFAPKRNDDIAMSWELGTFAGVNYYSSNLLPVHFSGNVGNDQTVLTLVSTNDPTGDNVTQLTFSGAGVSDANAIKSGDMFQFQDGVSGEQNIRYRQFIGHQISGVPVQFRSNGNVASSGVGNVTINITPALCSNPSNSNFNLSIPLSAGMQVLSVPDHVAGAIIGGNAAFLAMPKLPSTAPFPSSSEIDKDTGVSMRLYYGTLFGQNQYGYIHDATWASTIPPEYVARICIPLSQV